MPVVSSILLRLPFITRKFSTMTNLKEVISSKCFDGYQKTFSHRSKELECDMKFAIYLPPQAEQGKVPVLYFLNGLTANEENFLVKAGAQRLAAKHGLCIVSPDTSPRNVDIPGQNEFENVGYSASFYLDATQPPWSKHYKMYSYVTKELVELIESSFPVIPERKSISGFSMGGHGALICALKNPGMYRSLSCLEGLTNPINSPVVQRPFTTYLGANKEDWKPWDASYLISQYKGPPVEIFLDQGTCDPYHFDGNLLPENFVEAAAKNDLVNAYIKWRKGYNHSHFYVSTFIEEHIEYHMKALNETPKL